MSFKLTRVSEYVRRLTQWHDPWPDLRRQPFVILEREMSVEDALRRFPQLEGKPYQTVGFRNIGGIQVELVEPLHIDLDPRPAPPGAIPRLTA